MTQRVRVARFVLPMLFLNVLLPATGGAHCDTMNGPVVKAAQNALERGDVRLVLLWVKPEAESEIRSLFEQVRSARTQGEVAKSVADRLFFETVVRIHRAGEGAPFTGLKGASEPLEPGVAEAEASIEAHSPKALAADLTALLDRGLEESFHSLQAASAYPPGDVAAGRRYVAAYVRYLHYVERLHKTIAPPDGGHGSPADVHSH